MTVLWFVEVSMYILLSCIEDCGVTYTIIWINCNEGERERGREKLQVLTGRIVDS